MELPLIYPTKELKTVNIGVLSMKVIRIMSNEQFLKDGSLPFELLAAVCRNTTAEQIKDLSLVDAHRIMLTAWKQTHDKKQYIAKQYCECGKLVVAIHDTKLDYERPDIYDDVVEIQATDPDTLQLRTYTVKLCPLPLSLQSDILKTQLGDDLDISLEDVLTWCRIKSIDGREDFDKDSIPLPLYVKISELSNEDVSVVSSMLQKTVKCECGKEVMSTLSWTDSTFLQGK